MLRPLVIANPFSGRGRVGRTLEGVRAVLERRVGPVDVALTTQVGHGIELSHDAVRGGRTLVVAVGGDGTLHEVANGVLDAGGAAAVGYVGQGTGGDFARALGLRHRLDAYVEAIAAGRERPLDVGRIRYVDPEGTERTRWFVNIVSAGMSGLVDRHVAQTTRAFGGSAAYYLASLRALLECERARLRCDVSLAGAPSTRDLSTFMVAICNGSYFGAGMHVAPMAVPDDGRFEVVSMDASSKLALALESRRIYEGTHLRSAGVEHFACDRISLERLDGRGRNALQDAFLLDVDGEPLGGLPLHVELVPRALRMLT